MTSSSSVSVPQLMKDEEPVNWAELPLELLSSILLRLGMVEILISAQKVCRSWRRICNDPSVWRKIDMRGLEEVCRLQNYGNRYIDIDGLCRQAVYLSQGGLLEIYISYFGNNDLLSYIANRSSNLRSLELKMVLPIMNERLVYAVAKLPLLETLEIILPKYGLDLKVIGQACKQLQKLKLGYARIQCYGDDEDDDALAIAGNMPQLRHLQLIGNRLTDTGLNAILDNLPHLKHLDIRMCYNINLVGILEKRCVEKVKELRRPNDSMADCPFNVIFDSSESVDNFDYYDYYQNDDDYNYYQNDDDGYTDDIYF